MENPRQNNRRAARSLAAALAATSALGCGPREASPAREPAATTIAPAAEPQPPASAASGEPPAAAEAQAPPEPEGPAFPDVPFTLRGEQDRAIEVYPPLSARGRWPMVVLLHATCMQPRPVCDAFGNAGRDVGWLVCPAGNSTCYGEPDWSGTGPVKAEFLRRALRQAEASVAPFVDERPGVLVGWSRGAYAARDILATARNHRPDSPELPRFSGLVLLAASVPLDAKWLRSVGVERVVLAAGDHDGARGSMTSTAASLKASGMEARYVSLGKIGHWWPSDFEARMSEPIAWASRRPEAAPEGGEAQRDAAPR